LLKIPTIHRATHIIGNLPDLALEGGTLLGTGHGVSLIESVFNSDSFYIG
jgi:hypothetical protein